MRQEQSSYSYNINALLLSKQLGNAHKTKQTGANNKAWDRRRSAPRFRTFTAAAKRSERRKSAVTFMSAMIQSVATVLRLSHHYTLQLLRTSKKLCYFVRAASHIHEYASPLDRRQSCTSIRAEYNNNVTGGRSTLGKYLPIHRVWCEPFMSVAGTAPSTAQITVHHMRTPV